MRKKSLTNKGQMYTRMSSLTAITTKTLAAPLGRPSEPALRRRRRGLWRKTKPHIHDHGQRRRRPQQGSRRSGASSPCPSGCHVVGRPRPGWPRRRSTGRSGALGGLRVPLGGRRLESLPPVGAYRPARGLWRCCCCCQPRVPPWRQLRRAKRRERYGRAPRPATLAPPRGPRTRRRCCASRAAQRPKALQERSLAPLGRARGRRRPPRLAVKKSSSRLRRMASSNCASSSSAVRGPF